MIIIYYIYNNDITNNINDNNNCDNIGDNDDNSNNNKCFYNLVKKTRQTLH